MQKSVIVIASLICLAGLWHAAMGYGVPRMERSLEAEVQRLLTERRLHWARPAVSGWTVTLSGPAPGNRARAAALAAAAEVQGIRSVVSRIDVLVAEDTCRSQLDAALGGERIDFTPGAVTLEPDSIALIPRLAAVLRNCGAEVEIAGYTDSSGEAADNLRLSQQRADAVRRELLRFGVAPSRVDAVGYGEADPIADNASAEGRARNRRIELRLAGVAGP